MGSSYKKCRTPYLLKDLAFFSCWTLSRFEGGKGKKKKGEKRREKRGGKEKKKEKKNKRFNLSRFPVYSFIFHGMSK